MQSKKSGIGEIKLAGEKPEVVIHVLARETVEKINEEQVKILQRMIALRKFDSIYEECKVKNSATYKSLCEIFGEEFVTGDYPLVVFTRIINQTISLAQNRLSCEELLSNDRYFSIFRSLISGGHGVTTRTFNKKELINLIQYIDINELKQYAEAYPNIDDELNLLATDIKYKLYGLKAITLASDYNTIDLINFTIRECVQRNIYIDPGLKVIMDKLSNGNYTLGSSINTIKILGNWIDKINDIYDKISA